jgi:hypothetical protein
VRLLIQMRIVSVLFVVALASTSVATESAIEPTLQTTTRHPLPVRGFQGEKDEHRIGLEGQFNRASILANSVTERRPL